MSYRNEKGLALPAVIIIIAILLVLSASMMYVTSSQTVSIDLKKASENAFHIAEAGYYRYIWQLNDNSAFYKLSTKATDEFDPVEFYSGSETGASSAWTGYPKKYKETEYRGEGRLVGYYQIEVVPPSTSRPVVTIKSTGWTVDNAQVKRAIEVKVHKRQFTNYVGFMGDMRNASGDGIYWGDGEQVRGPVFTNGTLRTNGTPVFHDDVSYCVGWEKSGGNPDFKKPGQPVKATPLAFPSSNGEITGWANPAMGGYVYQGRTCILLNGNELKIRNVNVSGDKIVTRPLPASGVIYVDGTLFISGVLDGCMSIVTEGNIYITGKDPTNFSYNNAADTGGITYANSNIPTSATANTSGQSDDMLGMISNGNILINTRYWPRENSNTNHQSVSAAKYNITIHAAIFGLSANSYYGVDDYASLDDMGFIYFTGSQITNKVGATYRSSSSWGNTSIHGYKEDNSFDYRMAYETPPHFLEPANTGWQIKEWAEVKSTP